MREGAAHRLLAAGACVLALGRAAPLGAQGARPGALYVTGAVLADVKRFSGNPSENVLDGDAVGGLVGVGTVVGSRWELELALDLSRSTAVAVDRSVLLRQTRFTLETTTRNRPTTVDALVRFRPSPDRRVSAGFAAGLSIVRLRQDVETQVSPAGYPAVLIPAPVSAIQYSAAPTIGADALIRMGRRLSIVPALSATIATARDITGQRDIPAVLLRPRVGVRWTF